MLTSDMVLGFNASTLNGVGEIGQNCGPYTAPGFGFVDCTTPASVGIPNTVAQVRSYLANQTQFFQDFSVSFQRLLSTGYGVGSSKLGGPLTSIDLNTC